MEQDIVYPDEEPQEVEVFEYEKEPILEPFNAEDKLKQMLDFGPSKVDNYDLTPLFEHGDRLLQSVPKIDTEAKIKMMLEW